MGAAGRLSIRKQVLWGLVLSVVALAALEGLAVVFEKDAKYRYDEALGYRLMPGFRDERESVNADGLRGPEIEPKGPDTYRILAMGGSTTFGSSVHDEDAWPARLQTVLREAGHDEVQVLNGGVNGYGLGQIVRVLEDDYIERFAPDLVLVYSGWNYAAIEGNPTITRYRMKSKLSPVREGIYVSAMVRRLARLRKRMAHKALAVEKEDGDLRQERVQALEESFPPLALHLAELCRLRGVALGFVVYPSAMQLDPPAPLDAETLALANEILQVEVTTRAELLEEIAPRRDRVDHALGVVRASATAAGVPLLEVADAMSLRLDTGDGVDYGTWLRLFTDGAHKSPEGNGLIAECIVPMLAAQGWFPR